ncbi:hypothetical protein CDAR_294921 [Caerostris darwini]|uniref:Uncharacterized protein n=1 Tax=Caerostris darwini TaxID=1538125 RepID=A0AAV4UKU1_9ARAC|nr:hypothetical protein CDAR_294921 [Caerostris darwini]
MGKSCTTPTSNKLYKERHLWVRLSSSPIKGLSAQQLIPDGSIPLDEFRTEIRPPYTAWEVLFANLQLNVNTHGKHKTSIATDHFSHAYNRKSPFTVVVVSYPNW